MSRLSAAGWASIPRALLALALVFAAHAAHARTETLQWEYSAPGRVDGFRAHVGSSSQSYHSSVDLGLPVPDASGVYSATVEVADDATVYLALTAYSDDAGTSPFSNEILREAPTGTDGSSGDSGSDDSTSGDGSSGSDGDGSSDPSGSGESPGSGATVGASERLFYEGFEGHATGTAVPLWLDTAPNNSMSEQDGLFAVVDAGGNRALHTSSEATNIHSHYAADEGAGWSSYELRGRMRVSDASGGIGVVAYSRYDRENAYYRLRRYEDVGFEIAIHPHDAQDALSCTSTQTGVVPEAGRWYRYRLQVEDQGDAIRIRAMAWPAGAAQPTQWQAECVDARAARLGAGTVGAWSMGPGAKSWDDFEVVPLTAPAPPPDDGTSDVLGPPGRPVLVP